MRDQLREINPVLALAPAPHTATVNGTGVDRQLGEALTFIVNIGAKTDGTHALKLQESSDNATWTDVAAADQLGTFTADITASTVQSVGYIGSLRYVRVVSTVTGATTGAVYGAVAFTGYLRLAPSGATIV